MDVADIQELRDDGILKLVHILGKENPVDAMTHLKTTSKAAHTTMKLVELVSKGYYVPPTG